MDGECYSCNLDIRLSRAVEYFFTITTHMRLVDMLCVLLFKITRTREI